MNNPLPPLHELNHTAVAYLSNATYPSPTSYDKIAGIRAVRAFTHCGLKEAKDFVEKYLPAPTTPEFNPSVEQIQLLLKEATNLAYQRGRADEREQRNSTTSVSTDFIVAVYRSGMAEHGGAAPNDMRGYEIITTLTDEGILSDYNVINSP